LEDSGAVVDAGHQRQAGRGRGALDSNPAGKKVRKEGLRRPFTLLRSYAHCGECAEDKEADNSQERDVPPHLTYLRHSALGCTKNLPGFAQKVILSEAKNLSYGVRPFASLRACE
jgi:hypothetical protein